MADGFQADLDRPYRPALPENVALKLLERDRAIGIDGDCLAALIESLGTESTRQHGRSRGESGPACRA